MQHQALLLNHNYEVLAFITERKAIRLLVKEKADSLHVWDDYFIYLKKKIHYPSVLRLRSLIRKPPHRIIGFTRRAVLRRDEYVCQYCGCELWSENSTIDHIVPKKHGGPNSFLNCVASCLKCNTKKGARTPDQAGMVLLSKPYIPSLGTMQKIENKMWSSDWKFYLGGK